MKAALILCVGVMSLGCESEKNALNGDSDDAKTALAVRAIGSWSEEKGWGREDRIEFLNADINCKWRFAIGPIPKEKVVILDPGTMKVIGFEPGE